MKQPQWMHGNDWTGQDVSGWYASEKLRGWRVMWTGKEYLTRGGGVLDVPKSWIEGMPDSPLDGELYAGRHQNEGKVKSAVANGRWAELSFHPFDVPISRTITEASHFIIDAIKFPPHVHPVSFERVASTKAAFALRDAVVQAGGEGIMLRKPGTVYTAGRVDYLLKLKP